MMSLSHWGMLDASDVPHRYWPITWANFIDCLFENSQAESDAFFRYVDQVREGRT